MSRRIIDPQRQSGKFRNAGDTDLKNNGNSAQPSRYSKVPPGQKTAKPVYAPRDLMQRLQAACRTSQKTGGKTKEQAALYGGDAASTAPHAMTASHTVQMQESRSQTGEPTAEPDLPVHIRTVSAKARRLAVGNLQTKETSEALGFVHFFLRQHLIAGVYKFR